MIRARILVTGSELLDGRVVDTNSSYLCRNLNELGVCVDKVVRIGDGTSVIAKSILELLPDSDILIVSGGLGPTTDDLTRNGVAEALSRPLIINSEEMKRLEMYFAERGRIFVEQARQQAYFPEGSQLLDNAAGSASGFILERNDAMVIVVPGPPVELVSVWKQEAEPLVVRRFGCQRKPAKFYRFFGIPESYIGQTIVEQRLPASVEVSYRAASPEVHVVLKSESEAEVNSAAQKFEHAIDRSCIVNYSESVTLASEVAELLISKKSKVAVIENLAVGLAREFSFSAKAEEFFVGGLVVGQALRSSENGEVSETLNMRLEKSADYLLTISDSNLGLLPTGSFVVRLFSKGSSINQTFSISGSPERIRRYACWAAMDVLRRHLSELPQLQSI